MKNTSLSVYERLSLASIPLLLTCATVLFYYPSLFYDFQFDDIANIKKMFACRTHTFSMWAFKSSRWISYWLNTINYSLGKHNPFYYRFFNLSFHCITGILIFYITYTIFSNLKKNPYFSKKAQEIASFTTLLFLLHPVQTQTVSYVIQGQLEGLANMFTMAIIACFLWLNQLKTITPKVLLILCIYTLCFIGCGTKEIFVMTPALLFLVDWFFVAQGSWKKLQKNILFFLGYLTTMVYYFGFHIIGSQAGAWIKRELLYIDKPVVANIGNVITHNVDAVITRWDYFISQFKVIIHYITIFLWPFNISVDYDWMLETSPFSAQVILPALILLILLSITGFLLYKDKINIIAFGALWFFIGIAPRSSFIPSTELLADYKTYFSSYGLLLLCAILCVVVIEKIITLTSFQRHQKNIAFYSSFLCVLLLGYATYQRNKVWRSPQEFWFNIIQNAPKKARAYNNYAVSLAEEKRYKEAIPYLRKAIKMDAHYPDPWNNIAVCYNALGKINVAIEQLYQAIKINPTYPEFYNNLASFLLAKKQYPEVCVMAQNAIQLRSHYGKAYFNWGRALYEMNKKEEAFEKIKHACIKADYDTPEGFDTYAKLSLELAKFSDAAIGYQNLYNLDSSNKDALFNLGNALFCMKDYQGAEQVYKQLITENSGEYRSWFNLAETYVETRQYEKALLAFRKASPLGTDYPDVARRIAQFEKQKEHIIT